jgi:hypothetical protein
MTRMILPLTVCALLAAAPNAAADATACAQAASQGQTLRDAHKLLEARDQFRACAATTCPRVLQPDCTMWFQDVEKAIPTIVLQAKDGGGGDLIDVRVTVDGQPFAMRLDGLAVAMNPGAHVFRFELPDGASVEKQQVVREGEKNSTVLGVFPKKEAPPPPAPVSEAPGPLAAPPVAPAAPLPQPALPPPPTPIQRAVPERQPAASSGSSVGTGLLVAGVVTTVAGGIVGAVAGLVTLSGASDLKTACSGTSCPPSERSNLDSVKSTAMVSNIGFGVAGVGLVLVTIGVSLPSVGGSTEKGASGRPWLAVGPRGAFVGGTFR